jgi:hypothetical protein
MCLTRFFRVAGVVAALCASVAAEEPPRALVVVAPRRFHEALAPFVAHKAKRLPTTLVALEDVLRGPGVDDPEKVKRFLFARSRSGDGPLGYALLVGDADVFPVRYTATDRGTKAAADVAFYPSDLYYADLARADGTFDDWNGCKDGFHAGYFGEVHGETRKDDAINFDAIDYLPDIAVGRWPVRTVEHVRTIARKTIAFETVDATACVALFTTDGWVDSRTMLDRVAAALPDAVEKRYYGGGPAPDEDALVTLCERGVDLVLHAGHGECDGWHGCLAAAGIARLPERARLPVMYSAGCSTASFAPLPPYDGYVDVDGKEHAGTNGGKESFDAPPPPPAPYQPAERTSMAERLLLAPGRGAVAYIGCNTGSQPCGLTLMEGFALAHGKSRRLGDAWTAAVRHYHRTERLAELKPTESWYPPAIFHQATKFMLFGDPSLAIR